MKRNGRFIEHRNRVNYMFDHSNRKVDLRVRSTNDEIEMVLKLGHIGAHRRKEVSFKLGKIRLEDALDFLYHLGYKKGMKGTRISDVFKYRGVEFVVVSVPGRSGYHSYYFEIEGLAKRMDEVPKVKRKLISILQKMELRIFGNKEYDEYLFNMNQHASERFTLKG